MLPPPGPSGHCGPRDGRALLSGHLCLISAPALRAQDRGQTRRPGAPRLRDVAGELFHRVEAVAPVSTLPLHDSPALP